MLFPVKVRSSPSPVQYRCQTPASHGILITAGWRLVPADQGTLRSDRKGRCGQSELASEWKEATVDVCATPFGVRVGDPGSVVVVPVSATVSLLTGSRTR